VRRQYGEHAHGSEQVCVGVGVHTRGSQATVWSGAQSAEAAGEETVWRRHRTGAPDRRLLFFFFFLHFVFHSTKKYKRNYATKKAVYRNNFTRSKTRVTDAYAAPQADVLYKPLCRGERG
jgi:hypothetical protein